MLRRSLEVRRFAGTRDTREHTVKEFARISTAADSKLGNRMLQWYHCVQVSGKLDMYKHRWDVELHWK